MYVYRDLIKGKGTYIGDAKLPVWGCRVSREVVRSEWGSRCTLFRNSWWSCDWAKHQGTQGTKQRDSKRVTIHRPDSEGSGRPVSPAPWSQTSASENERKCVLFDPPACGPGTLSQEGMAGSGVGEDLPLLSSWKASQVILPCAWTLHSLLGSHGFPPPPLFFVSGVKLCLWVPTFAKSLPGPQIVTFPRPRWSFQRVSFKNMPRLLQTQITPGRLWKF